ncbi:MAG: hypothetical protein M3081_08885 [Gemmatimonadota bacterium]|nr:hypothetical protein [Gemmatimonadota bacterium]
MEKELIKYIIDPPKDRPKGAASPAKTKIAIISREGHHAKVDLHASCCGCSAPHAAAMRKSISAGRTAESKLDASCTRLSVTTLSKKSVTRKPSSCHPRLVASGRPAPAICAAAAPETDDKPALPALLRRRARVFAGRGRELDRFTNGK